MEVVKNEHNLSEYDTTCYDDIDKIIVNNDQIIKFELGENWQLSRVLTDYIYKGDDAKEFILIIRRKE